jgi:hypothetical protein
MYGGICNSSVLNNRFNMVNVQFSLYLLSLKHSTIFKMTIMNTQTATAKAINWNKVLHVTFRATWWLLKTLFQLAVVLGTTAFAAFVFLYGNGTNKDEPIDRNKGWGSGFGYDGETDPNKIALSALGEDND